MKFTGACPKCKGRVLYVISPVRQARGEDDPLPVISTHLRGHMQRVNSGTHDLYICADCGFEEWYACGANAMLDMLTAVPEAGVRKLGVTTPYR